jgi:hypothetical protein
MLGDLGPSLAWVVTRMASVAKIIALVLVMGKSVRTSGLWSFRAPIMSSKGEILGFLAEPLI